MYKPHKTIVFGLAAFFVIILIQPSIASSEGVPYKIIKKLNELQRTLDEEVVPKLDDCSECSECPPCEAGVPKTGQTDSQAFGDDGHLQRGIPWPVPRFTDNGDGTVTDCLTGLIWLKNANCEPAKTWDDAITFCNNLEDGDCGLTDGSIPGDWRLPNLNELMSLLHLGFHAPAIPNTAGDGQWSEGDPFTNVVSSWYWSSTTYVWVPTDAWRVPLSSGGMINYNKNILSHVWPVRSGY